MTEERGVAVVDEPSTPLHTDALVRVFHWLDSLSLVAASGVCRQWRAAAGDRTLWNQHLQDFFGGHLPPPMQDDRCADPRAELAAQLEAARALQKWEFETRAFQFPHSDAFPPIEKGWHDRLDSEVAKIQIAQGQKRASPGQPYYGCSGGAYGASLTVHGAWAKQIDKNGPAARFGIQGATVVRWVKMDCDTPVQRSSECDFGPMRKWLDSTIIELAHGSECKFHPRLAARAEAAQRAAADAGLYAVSAWSENSVSPASEHVKPTRVPALQVLGGAYGGLFEFGQCFTSIGTIYSLECTASKAHINDFSGM